MTNRVRKTKNCNQKCLQSGFCKAAFTYYPVGLNPAKSLVHCIPND